MENSRAFVTFQQFTSYP